MSKWALLAVIGLVLIAVWSLAGRRLSPDTIAALERAQNFRDAEAGSGLQELIKLNELGESRKIRSHEIMEICNPFSLECLEYIKESQLEELVSPAEDLKFAKQFEALPQVSMPIERVLDDSIDLLKLTTASRDIYLTQLITQGQINASTVATSLKRNRTNLTQADTLIEKLMFLAALSTDLSAANLSLQRGREGWAVLSEHLEALSETERSYQRTFDGETLFGKWWNEQEDSEPVSRPNHLLNLANNRYQSYAAASEASWEEFWSREHPIDDPSFLDAFIEPGIYEYLGDESAPNYLEYLTNVRFTDALIHLIRTIHLENFQEPYQQPAANPLPLWSWAWHDDSTFCLEPTNIHPAMQDYAETICASWFGADQFNINQSDNPNRVSQ